RRGELQRALEGGVDEGVIGVGVEAHPDHEMVFMLEEALRARRLQRSAKTVRRSPGPVDLPEHGTGRERIGDRIAVDIEQQRVCVTQAKIAGSPERARGNRAYGA